MIDHDLPIIKDNGFCTVLKGEIMKGARNIDIAMDGSKMLGNVFVNGMKFDKSGLVEAAVTFCFNEED